MIAVIPIGLPKTRIFIQNGARSKSCGVFRERGGRMARASASALSRYGFGCTSTVGRTAGSVRGERVVSDISDTAMGRALDFFGGHTAMARALCMTPRELWGARTRGQLSRRATERVHRLTLGTVRREEVRPDLYPRGRHFIRVKVRR